MLGFLDAAVAFPTALFTVLMGVVSFYWLLALVGLVEFDSDLDLPDLSSLAGLMAVVGLHGVPFSIVASLLILISWTLSCLGAMWLLPLLPGADAFYVGGTLMALASVSLAVPVAARIVSPMRGLFVTHAAVSNTSLVGQRCKVLTMTVDERTGRAEVPQVGASINIKVWATTPNLLVRGSNARVVSYDEKKAGYCIEPDE